MYPLLLNICDTLDITLSSFCVSIVTLVLGMLMVHTFWGYSEEQMNSSIFRRCQPMPSILSATVAAIMQVVPLVELL